MNDGGNADPDLRHAEFGVVGGDPEIAGGRDLQPAAEAPAGHPCDHRRGKRAHRLAEIAQAGDEGFRRRLVETGHFLDVGAADHALFALAGHHQHADGPIRRELLQTLADAIDDGRAQNVERAGVANGQADDAAGVAVDAAVRIEHVHG